MHFLFSEIPEICRTKKVKISIDSEIIFFFTDSRKPIIANESLFLAIKGERHDAHDYLLELYAKGCRYFIVEDASHEEIFAKKDVNIILVENTILVFQKLMEAYRKSVDYPFIGVTGSNGKTIIKEWLFKILNTEYVAYRSPKSYNSQLGVPISIAGLTPKHEVAILEAGISKVDEMQRLANMILPDYGIFSNLGTAHHDGFRNQREKLREKCKLFISCKKIIYNKDQLYIDKQFKNIFSSDQLFSWSLVDTTASLHYSISKIENKTQINFVWENRLVKMLFPLADSASIENILHAITLSLLLKVPICKIRAVVEQVEPVSMRLELKKGINNCQIVDDSYNNDFMGLKMALDFLAEHRKSKNTLILSDLKQTGQSSTKVYKQIQKLIKQKRISRLIAIGPNFLKYKNLFPSNSHFFESTDSFLGQLDRSIFRDEMILIKGSRDFQFESIVNRLEEKLHGARLEVDLDALIHNLNFYKSKLDKTTKIMVMVKAFAYGNGSEEIAKLLEYHRIDYLGVAYTDEGVFLRKAGVKLPIMVMNVSSNDFENILDYNLESEIYSFSLLEKYLDFLREKKQSAKIHLKVDTGMHRLGFEPEDVDRLCEILKKENYIKVEGIFSHMVASDNPEEDFFSINQADKFIAFSDRVISELKINPIRHLLNSAGIINFPEYHLDMVRLGIGLYGLEVTGTFQQSLENVSVLKTIISQIKTVEKGDTIGYSRAGQVRRKSKIATIAIGYADGFSRVFGNGKYQVKVNGSEAPVVGNVCMDMTMIDVTGISVEEGDEVIIFEGVRDLKKLSILANTIPYEILTSIGRRVKRIFFTV